MIPENATTFDRPFVLLCEGKGDVAFYHRFFEVHNLGQDFRIRHPEKKGVYSGGRGNFGKDLFNMSLDENFIQHVQTVLVVADCDDSRADSFKRVQDQLEETKIFPVPEAEKTLAKSTTLKNVVILLLPFNETGNLEKMCLPSAYKKWDLKAALDQYVDATPAKEWPVGKQSKTRMNALLAATNRKNPDTGFASHWSAKPEFQIPLEDESFDDLIAFFRTEFPEIVAA